MEDGWLNMTNEPITAASIHMGQGEILLKGADSCLALVGEAGDTGQSHRATYDKKGGLCHLLICQMKASF